MNFRRFEFRNRLLLILLLAIIPLIIVGVALGYFQVKRSFERNIENQLSSRANVLLSLVRSTVLVSNKNKLHAIENIRPSLLSFKSGDTGYAYILDEEGTLVFHPTLPKVNFLEQSMYSNQFLKQMIEKKSGRIQYRWEDPGDTQSREKIVYFNYLTEFKWIVASSSYADEVYAPLKSLKQLLFVFAGILLLVFGGAAFLISVFMSRPIEGLVKKLNKGMNEDSLVRQDGEGPPEFDALCRQFNLFVGQLEKNKAKMESIIQKNFESQTALVENDLKLRSLFDQSFQYMGILSPFGILEQINQSLVDFSGCRVQNTLYKPFWEAYWWRHDCEVQKKIKASVQLAMKGEFVRFETTSISGGEQIHHIDLSIKPVFLPSEEVAFIIAEGRDITKFRQTAMEKRNLAVQLERSQKMEAIGTLAGGIAHDFNNILSGILGYAQLVEMSLDNPGKAKAHLREIGQGAHRAADLIQQILTFSRQTEFEKQPLSLHLVVKEALKLMRSSIPTTIEINESILSKEKILADPTQMHQVIMNLCTNAYHAMDSAGGVLNVQLRTCEISDKKDVFLQNMAGGKYLELMIRDTGHGMDKETLSKAFDPYFTTKDVGKGTGFGLALVNAIIYEHEGYIDVKSRKGEGASFYVYLPVVEGETDQKFTPGGKKTLEGGTESIMVVDDEEGIRNILSLFLTSLGYSVAVFENGVTALADFERAPQKYDLIITDMTMPKMAGDELAMAVLKCRGDIPVILCTGYSEVISKEQSIRMGINQYIQKPVDTRELSVLIRSIFDETSS